MRSTCCVTMAALRIRAQRSTLAASTAPKVRTRRSCARARANVRAPADLQVSWVIPKLSYARAARLVPHTTSIILWCATAALTHPTLKTAYRRAFLRRHAATGASLSMQLRAVIIAGVALESRRFERKSIQETAAGSPVHARTAHRILPPLALLPGGEVRLRSPVAAHAGLSTLHHTQQT